MSNPCVISASVVLSPYFIVSLSLCLYFTLPTTAALYGGVKDEGGGSVPVPLPVPGKHGTVVSHDERRGVVSTEFGEISTVKVSDGRYGFYDLQFITMEPNSLFVPVHLHSDMVFYVNSGSGTLSWVDLKKDKDKGKLRQVELRTGDVYRLQTGSFFYLESNLDSDRRKFRINAIFSDSKEEIREGSSFGAYSSVADLLLGFDDIVLQAALNVDEVALQELRSGGRQQMIVHGVSKANANELFEMHYRNMRAFLGLIDNGMIEVNKDKKGKAYNILEAKHDVENCNGWSLVVTSKQMDALKDSDFGIFYVNLTKGAMMGPHWNPLTAEIAVVVSGRGMVHVVCPSTLNETECKNSRFRVEEGDVFVVPRYHPMAQISFNNGSFVFVGFTTTQKNNHPQYLVGSASVFQVLNKRVLAASLGVSNTTMVELLSAQSDEIILECTSCAEEEERLMEEEIQQRKAEEERKKEEEEEARKREEARREQEEARKREEEAARREQEEAQKREEEAARREQEEARKREEEEEAARREQEEARKREEEEEAARREKEEAREREEEEAARQQEEAAAREQEEARKREEEAKKRQQEEQEAKRRQEEEEAAATRRRQQEEEAAQEQEEEAERRWQEEEEITRQKRDQEEAARREQEQEDAGARQEAEAKREQQEEAAARRQDEAMRRQQEEEAARQQEEAMRHHQQDAGVRKKYQEEAAAKQQKAAGKKRDEEKMTRWGGGGGAGGSGHQRQGEGEAAVKKEEEMARRQREADEAEES